MDAVDDPTKPAGDENDNDANKIKNEGLKFVFL